MDNNALQKINLLKREQVASCLNIVKNYPFVKKMIIFGSSVTDNCGKTSDLDICLDFDGTFDKMSNYNLHVELRKACNHNCDILKYHKINGEIKNEIDNKGVIVYDIS